MKWLLGNKWLRLLAFMLILLASYVSYILISTGFFRTVSSKYDGSLYKTHPIPGVEDFAISYEDDFLLLSSDHRAARRDGRPEQGHLYFIDLKDSSFTPEILTDELNISFYPHGIDMYKTGRRTYRIWAINHANDEHTIEVFRLRNRKLKHLETLRDSLMISPNDVIALDKKRFYYTNDHGYTEGIGKWAEEYLGLAVSNVMYYDGKTHREVADGIAYANGITYDAPNKKLFVASPRSFSIQVFDTPTPDSLIWVDAIDCNTGVDNLLLDNERNIWTGAHPSLLAYSGYAKGNKKTSPSQVQRISYNGIEDYVVETVYQDDGTMLGASSVAVPYGPFLFVGTVLDEKFVVLKTSLQ